MDEKEKMEQVENEEVNLENMGVGNDELCENASETKETAD